MTRPWQPKTRHGIPPDVATGVSADQWLVAGRPSTPMKMAASQCPPGAILSSRRQSSGESEGSGWSELPHLPHQLERDGVPVESVITPQPPTDNAAMARPTQGTGSGPGGAEARKPQCRTAISLCISGKYPTDNCALRRAGQVFGNYPDVESSGCRGTPWLSRLCSGAHRRTDRRPRVPEARRAQNTCFTDAKCSERSFLPIFHLRGQKRGKGNWQDLVF